MEIKILTYQRAYNFGAFLQAFALKSCLQQAGHMVSFVDYWPDEHAKRYALFRKECVHSVPSLCRELVLSLLRTKRYKSMRQLQRKYLGLTRKPQYRNPEELACVSADAVVYGSDQIWWKSGLEKKGFDTVYWGEKIDKKIPKIAYAPSMGVLNLDDHDRETIKNLLRNFSSLSVRESALGELLDGITDKVHPTVLDPTLLLPRSFWNRYCQPVTNKKFILYYKVMGSAETDRLADDLGKKLQLPVIKILGSINTYHSLDRYSIDMDSFRFISMIKNAALVLSTSFHGTAFSILFEKQFYAMSMGNNSGRVGSLLHKLGIEDRLVDVHSFHELPPIDYMSVNIRLEQERSLSVSYLFNALSH